MSDHPSMEHRLAQMGERLARLETNDTYHLRSLDHLSQQVSEVATIASSLRQEAVGVVLSLRAEIARIQEERQPQSGPTEATIKISIAIVLPLLVWALTRDPQQAAGIAKSLLSPGMGGGH